MFLTQFSRNDPVGISREIIWVLFAGNAGNVHFLSREMLLKSIQLLFLFAGNSRISFCGKRNTSHFTGTLIYRSINSREICVSNSRDTSGILHEININCISWEMQEIILFLFAGNGTYSISREHQFIYSACFLLISREMTPSAFHEK